MMLVLDNLMLFHMYPCGCHILAVCVSLDIFYPAVFVGASPNG